MNEARHTPGPWEVREHEGLFAFAWERGFVIESDSVEQDRADARLIAAAPELLAALKAVYATLYDNQCEIGLQAAAAIAKAEGKEAT